MLKGGIPPTRTCSSSTMRFRTRYSDCSTALIRSIFPGGKIAVKQNGLLSAQNEQDLPHIK